MAALSSIQTPGFREVWLSPGSIVPVDVAATSALVREVIRLRSELKSAIPRAYVLEEAARVCDGIQARSKEAYENGVPMEKGNPQVMGEHEGARVCAKLIRALKEPG
jgi:hypothetical protein